MKNLKRALSFALATVMVIGMMVVGAGAAFTDEAKIVNEEAVDVMVSLGVISGKGDGSYFDPDATLTRAEAAKMIACLLRTPEKAAKLGVRIRPVEDMKQAHRILSGSRVSDGFGDLADKKQLSLSLEALVVDKRFTALFSDEEANTALDRLLAAGYTFK